MSVRSIGIVHLSPVSAVKGSSPCTTLKHNPIQLMDGCEERILLLIYATKEPVVTQNLLLSILSTNHNLFLCPFFQWLRLSPSVVSRVRQSMARTSTWPVFLRRAPHHPLISGIVVTYGTCLESQPPEPLTVSITDTVSWRTQKKSFTCKNGDWPQSGWDSSHVLHLS